MSESTAAGSTTSPGADEPEGEPRRTPVRLSTRSRTLLVSGGLLVVLVALAALLPVPYVVMQPGPTENTLGAFDGTDVIVISGRETFPTEGNLDLTTVSVTSADRELNLVEALQTWLDPQAAVVPREQVYPTDESADEVRERNAEQMATSQESAVAAALTELGIAFEHVPVVASIVEGAPALGVLKAGDEILAVDGDEVAVTEDVGRLVTAHQPGETVEFTVRRDDEQLDLEVTTVAAEPQEGDDEGEAGRAVIGISVGTGFVFPFDVSITLGESIGGPSAGLMFSLGIVDKLTPGPLTDGAYVAGTGTIDAEGAVGAIGGIQQKIAGAKNKGATVFLVPADNCPEAAAAEIDGVRLVEVSTLADAVDALEGLAAGEDVPGCG